MIVRIITHLAVSAYILFYLIKELAGANGYLTLLVLSPYMVMNLLDIYYLLKALRNRPKAVDARISSVILSLVVTCHGILLLLCEPNPYPMEIIKRLGAQVHIFSMLLIVWALLSLKNNLTVLPEANSLIKTGPYKYVRHPLYFAYIVMSVDEFMMYQTVPIFFISILQIVLLLIRAKREENILIKNLPDYKDYFKKTAWFKV